MDKTETNLIPETKTERQPMTMVPAPSQPRSHPSRPDCSSPCQRAVKSIPSDLTKNHYGGGGAVFKRLLNKSRPRWSYMYAESQYNYDQCGLFFFWGGVLIFEIIGGYSCSDFVVHGALTDTVRVLNCNMV